MLLILSEMHFQKARADGKPSSNFFWMLRLPIIQTGNRPGI
jgi:hypothetical protein